MQLGEFSVVGLVGEGGSATVYSARWLDQTVALKVMRAELAVQERYVARFLEEGRALARVDHPGVVRALASGTLPDGRAYLAMPLLTGQTLALRWRSRPCARVTAWHLISQLADAVEAIHAAGLVHRDLKPENVFVDDSGRVTVLDFGIACDAGAPPTETTARGLVRGTAACMAPERLFGTPASRSTDIYELAVVACFVFTGRLPWDPPEDPRARLQPDLPRDLPGTLARVLRRSLSTRPELRPASARAFAAEVHAAIET